MTGLWDAVFCQPKPSLENVLALLGLCVLRFRLRCPFCEDPECTETATTKTRGRYFCDMHVPRGQQGTPLWPPLTLEQIETALGGGVRLVAPPPAATVTKDDKNTDDNDDDDDIDMSVLEALEAGPLVAPSEPDTVAESLSFVPEHGEEGCSGISETCRRLGIVYGFDNVIDAGLRQDIVDNGGEIPIAHQKVLAPARVCGIFLALLHSSDGVKYRSKRVAKEPFVVVPATARQFGMLTDWKEVKGCVAFIGVNAVERATYSESQTAGLIALALERAGGFKIDTDGLFNVESVDQMGAHRLMARWHSIIEASANNLRAFVSLQTLTRTDTYDLPLPSRSDLKLTRAKEPPHRLVVLNGYERFALYNLYTPQQRLCIFMEKEEFPKRRWWVKGDAVFVSVFERPRVLVRARTCLRCHRESCGCSDGEFVPDPVFRHVCATCGVSREAHPKHGGHVFLPKTVATGEPVSYGAFEPASHRDKKNLTLEEAVAIAADSMPMLKDIVVANPAISSVVTLHMRQNPHRRYLRVDSDRVRTGNGVFVKHDRRAGPRHYSHVCECPDDFSVIGSSYRLCFLHKPCTFASSGTNDPLEGVCVASVPDTQGASSSNRSYTLVRANPEPDASPHDEAPVRVYGYASKKPLRYRTLVPLRLATRGGGPSRTVNYYVARDQSRKPRRLTVRFQVQQLTKALGPLQAAFEKAEEAVREILNIREPARVLILGTPGQKHVDVEIPEWLLRQVDKAHESCILGVPNPPPAGVAISRMHVALSRHRGPVKNEDDEQEKEEEIRRVICWDQEYNDYVFEGEQTTGYNSLRLTQGSDGQWIPPSPSYALCTGRPTHCAHCDKKLTRGQLEGKEDLPECAGRRFGWRCCPFTVSECSMACPLPGHCDDFIKIFQAQGYFASPTNAPWRLPPKQKPLCSLYHIFMMLGRLFCRLNRFDRHQVALIFIGIAASGKSLVQECIKNMNGHENTFQLPSSEQETFGPLLHVEQQREDMGRDHLLILANEMSRTEPNRYKIMIEGGDLTENVKHENKLKCIRRFPNPYMATTNSIPESLCRSSSDGQGAILRRLNLIAFGNRVKTIDPSMNRKLGASVEFILPMIMRCYNMHVKYRATRDFWQGIVPEDIIERARPFTDAMNLLKVFTDRSEFIQDDQAYMPYEDFVNMYNEWCKKENRARGETWSDTRCLSWLQGRGMVIKDKDICIYPPPGADPQAVSRYLEDANLQPAASAEGDADSDAVIGKFIHGIGLVSFFPATARGGGQEEDLGSQTLSSKAEAYLMHCSAEEGAKLIHRVFMARGKDFQTAAGVYNVNTKTKLVA